MNIGNGTITITQNGVVKGSFTVNQSSNATIALTDNNTQTITGVKGNAENTYRTGNVNLTPSNIGAVETSKVLSTKEKINTNTDATCVAGATAVKTMVSEKLPTQFNIKSGNFNDITTPGIYSVALSSVTNAPENSGWGLMLVVDMDFNPKYAFQVLIASDTKKMYVRGCENGIWRAWASI